MKSRRIRKTTIAGEVATMAALSNPPSTFKPVSQEEQRYFDFVIQAREAMSWSPNDIILAQNLAVSYVQLDAINGAIKDLGIMVVNAKGTPVANPAISAKAALSSSILQLNRALGLSAASRGLTGEEQRVRNKADAQARDVINRAAGSDDLLA